MEPNIKFQIKLSWNILNEMVWNNEITSTIFTTKDLSKVEQDLKMIFDHQQRDRGITIVINAWCDDGWKKDVYISPSLVPTPVNKILDWLQVLVEAKRQLESESTNVHFE